MTCVSEDRGQMAVEMAVCIPVVLVVAIVIANAAWYMNLCAKFDRVALDMAIAHGVSPSGEQDLTNAAREIEAALREAMGEDVPDIQVKIEHIPWFGVSEGIFTISPTRVRIECWMGFRPWPQRISLGFMTAEMPAIAPHRRSVVVDVGRLGLGGDSIDQ